MVTKSKGNASPSLSLNEGDEARRVTTLDDHNFSFGPFTLFPGRRLLQRRGATVRLGSRACEILVALVERAGELVHKNELMARVWPGISVVEGNLRTQMNDCGVRWRRVGQATVTSRPYQAEVIDSSRR